MIKDFDIVIVGAGPAGLAAAIEAKACNQDAKVLVLEKMEEPAKKLSATGNGRGNLTNESCTELEQVLEFFKKSGIAVRADDAGRIYPYSEEAKAVSSALVKRAKGLGAEIWTNARVSNVEARREGSFHIFISEQNNSKDDKQSKGKSAKKSCSGIPSCANVSEVHAKKLLIATGGKSFANYGSAGDGFSFARALGHEVMPLVPGLTAIEVKENLKDLKGVRAKVSVSLMQGGNVTFKEDGEIQFREDSISGICVMNMSSMLPVAERTGRCSDEVCDAVIKKNPLDDCKILVNFVPEFTTTGLMGFFQNQMSMPDVVIADLLETVVKKAVVQRILKDAAIDPKMSVAEVTPVQLVAVANKLRGFELNPCGKKGWKEAQITKGGVSLNEIDLETMESKLVPGLYFAGEVTDFDAPCGGFNLHNAWITGLKAGRNMVK